jgi:hypothetical protein
VGFFASTGSSALPPAVTSVFGAEALRLEAFGSLFMA